MTLAPQLLRAALENGISGMYMHFLILCFMNVLREKRRKTGVVMAFFSFHRKRKMYERETVAHEIECKRLLESISADVEFKAEIEQCNVNVKLFHDNDYTEHTVVMHRKQLNCNNAIQRPS